MKNILLTTTALVAFAGAAAAEVSFKGDAKLGYNDKVKDGFYWEAGLGVTAEQELNNGLTAGFTLDVDLDIKDSSTFTNGQIATSDYVLYLKSDTASLYYGDTKPAVEQLFEDNVKTPVHEASMLDQETFIEDSDVDGGTPSNVEAVLRAETEMAGFKAAVSAFIFDDGAPAGNEEAGAVQLAVTGAISNINVGLAYQAAEKDLLDEKSNDADELFGLYAGTTFSGADVQLSYVKNATTKEDSLGLKGSYNFGAFTVGAFYSKESVKDQDNYGVEVAYKQGAIAADFWHRVTAKDVSETGLEGSYDFSNGLVAKAGYINTDPATGKNTAAFYVAGEYDLGSDASLLVSYAKDEANATNDAIGDPEYYSGATVAVSFKF